MGLTSCSTNEWNNTMQGTSHEYSANWQNYTEKNVAHLEQDIRGIKVAVADASAMHVFHAICNAAQHCDQRRPPVQHAPHREAPGCYAVLQIPTIAVLLNRVERVDHSHHSVRLTCSWK